MKQRRLNHPSSYLHRTWLADLPGSWSSKLSKLLGVAIVTTLLVACGLQEIMIEQAAEQHTTTTSEKAAGSTPVVDSEDVTGMEETSVQKKTLETPPCYLFAVQSDAQEGGRANQQATTYLAADGFVQASVETIDDKILELREGNIAEDGMLAGALVIILSAKSADRPTPTSKPDNNNIVTDYSPPNLHVRLGYCDSGLVEEWSGPIDNAPGNVAEMAAALQELAAQASPAEPSAGRYLRAQHLTPETVSQMEEAGILTTISPDELASDELLKAAVENPYRLIEVSATSDSNAVETTLQSGRSFNLLYKGQGYQVRQIVHEPS